MDTIITSAGIEDIGRAIDSMDEMTQQNSALAEQSAQLTGALSVFKLENASAPAATAGHARLALR
jgi:methyl-accepting chemotaxis protein